jgi:hypothetical protein
MGTCRISSRAKVRPIRETPYGFCSLGLGHCADSGAHRFGSQLLAAMPLLFCPLSQSRLPVPGRTKPPSKSGREKTICHDPTSTRCEMRLVFLYRKPSKVLTQPCSEWHTLFRMSLSAKFALQTFRIRVSLFPLQSWPWIVAPGLYGFDFWCNCSLSQNRKLSFS